MKKISISLSGHQTSITLEPEFIDILKKIARTRNISVASIVSDLDETRTPDTNLSSAVRVWILKQLLKTAKI